MTTHISCTSTTNYGCFYQKDASIPGRIYVTNALICFHANSSAPKTEILIPAHEITSIEKHTTLYNTPNAIQITTQGAKYTFTSFSSPNATYNVIQGARSSARTAENPAVDPSPAKSVEEPKQYTETALDTIIPGTPEKVYNLMFGVGFLRGFMTESQKLQDIQISDWQPVGEDSKTLTRHTSYMKPLNYVIGPRQTKCEIDEEVTISNSPTQSKSVLSTTRTPDIPNGGLFSVKTLTCIKSESVTTSRIVVTTEVQWTGRSYIRAIIERSAIEGQKAYYADLDQAMRQYISRHGSEFLIDAPSQPINVTDGNVRSRTQDVDVDHDSDDESSDNDGGDEELGYQSALDGFGGGDHTVNEKYLPLSIALEDHKVEDHDFEIIRPLKARLSLDDAELDDEWDHIEEIKVFILEGWRG